MSLAGRTLLVTGTTGIAAETARRAAAGGARVCVAGIDAPSGQALAAEIGGDCRFIQTDVTDPAQVVAAVEVTNRVYSRIDALFNVVGISGRRFGDGPVHECTDDGWDVTFATNARSTFLVCRETIRRMLAQEPDAQGLRGTVLTMASVVALSPEPRHFATHAYAASKAAILGLTRSMAAYYAPHGIRVNAIAPGLVRTPMSERAQQNPEIMEFMHHKQPLGEHLLAAEDVAEAALFLLGSGARAITGDALVVDNGWSVSG